MKSTSPFWVVRFLIRTYLRIGTNSVFRLFSESVSQWVSGLVCAQGRGFEITVYDWTWVGWTHWEWTVHVNTLYTVYTLNTMYILYSSNYSVIQAVSLCTRERFRDSNLQIFDKKLKDDIIYICIWHVYNTSSTKQNNQGKLSKMYRVHRYTLLHTRLSLAEIKKIMIQFELY